MLHCIGSLIVVYNAHNGVSVAAHTSDTSTIIAVILRVDDKMYGQVIKEHYLQHSQPADLMTHHEHTTVQGSSSIMLLLPITAAVRQGRWQSF